MTDIAEIESVIKCADVCRIALTDGNTPYIVTMNFGYSGGKDKRIYFHCAQEGRKLEMIRKNNYVCFELDTDHNLIKGKNACDFKMKYRSVVGYGHIAICHNDSDKKNGLDCIMSHYSEDKTFIYEPETFKRTTILCLEINQISGKKC